MAAKGSGGRKPPRRKRIRKIVPKEVFARKLAESERKKARTSVDVQAMIERIAREGLKQTGIKTKAPGNIFRTTRLKRTGYGVIKGGMTIVYIDRGLSRRETIPKGQLHVIPADTRHTIIIGDTGCTYVVAE